MPEARRHHVEITVVGRDAAGRLAAAIWPCYEQVFGDVGDLQTWRLQQFDRHAGREGYRLAVATDGADVVGFAWGYIGQRGQFWTDLVRDALASEVVYEWVGGHFELVELAVLPSHRRRGLGRELHDLLLDGVDRRCLLGTSDDADDPAVRLYEHAGWRSLGTLRPGVQVMGRDPAPTGRGR